MRNASCLLATLLLAAGICLAGPEVTVPSLSGPPPVIDGVLEDAWSDAAVIEGFTLLGEPDQAPTQHTRVRLLHGDDALYAAFECAEESMEELEAELTERDAPVWSEDCVELFVSPRHDGEGYYHLIVNALGTIRDERGKDETWDCTARAEVARAEDGWTLELLVPVAEMRLPWDVDGHWRLNITRNERPHGELSTWAPMEGKSFHEPELFGHLRGFDADFGGLLRAQALEQLGDIRRDVAALRTAARPYEAIRQGRVALGRAARLLDETERIVGDLQGGAEPQRLRERAADAHQLAGDSRELGRLVARLPLIKAAGERGYVISQASTMHKITPTAEFAGQPADAVELSLAGGEHEGAQVVIVPADRALADVTVSATGLRGPEGAAIDAGRVTVRRVGYVDVTRSTSKAPLGPGRVPDPLIAAEPFAVPEDEVRCVWVDVHAAADQPAGMYRGSLTIEPANAEAMRVPLVARVRDFALPRASWLRTSYGLGFNVSAFYPEITPGPGHPRWWSAGTWSGADMEGRPNYFGEIELTKDFDTEVKHGGRNSVRVQVTRVEPGTHESPRFAYYTPPLELQPGEEYTFELWYRTAPGEDPAAHWWMPDGGHGELAPTDGQWRQATGRFTMGGDGATRVYIRVSEPGTAWFDDARLSPAGELERNLLENPGFEMGRFSSETLMRDYRDNCLAHRCSPTGIGSPAIGSGEDGQLTIDWSGFDERVTRLIERGLTGFNISWCRLPSGWGEVAGFEEGDREAVQRATALLEQTQAHFVERGWENLGYIYTIDEPGADAFDEVKQAFGLSHEVAPRLKTLLTYGYGASRPIEPGNPRYADLAGFVDIHVPHSDCYEPIYLQQRREAGDEIWAYVCISAQRPWLNNWAIDYPGTDHRVLFWQLFDKEITGFLYWRITHWTENPWEEPMTYPGGNGDGSLIYPGEDGPVDSIRWELNRDGIEDYDMLAMLQEAANRLEEEGKVTAATRARAALDTSGVTSDWLEYTQDPAIVEQQRERVADALEQALAALGERTIEPPHAVGDR